jgi:hypothetical protein
MPSLAWLSDDSPRHPHLQVPLSLGVDPTGDGDCEEEHATALVPLCQQAMSDQSSGGFLWRHQSLNVTSQCTGVQSTDTYHLALPWALPSPSSFS